MLAKQLLALMAVVVILIGWLVADFNILYERYANRPAIEAEITNFLGRRFSLLDLKFDPLEGIELLNLRIQAQSGREEDDLFRAAVVHIRYNPASIARGQIEPTEVDLILPVFNFVPNPQKQWDLIEMVRRLSLGNDRRPAEAGILAARRKPIVRIYDGSARFGHPDLLAANKAFLLDHFDLSLHPFTGGRYKVEGGARSAMLGKWAVEGEMDIETQTAHYVFRGHGLKADANLEGILSPDLLNIWGHYAPAGLINLEVRVDIDAVHEENNRYFVIADFDGVRAQFWKFPYPAEDVRGRVEFHKEGAKIVGLDGRRGGCTFHVRGHTDGYGREAGVELFIDISKIPFDDTLMNAIPAPSRKGWELFQPSAGTLSGSVRVVRDHGLDQPTRTYMTLSCEDARFTFRDVPAAVSQVNGELKIDDRTITLSHLKGRRGGTDDTVEIFGVVRDLATDTPSYTVTVESPRLTLNEDLRKAVPPTITRIWELYRPTGALGLRLEARREPDPNAKPTLEMTVTCLGNTAVAGSLEYPVTDLTGSIHYHAPFVDLNHLEARHGGATIQVHGSIELDPSGNDFNLKIGGTAVPFDEALLRTMPEDFRNLLLEQNPSGALDFTAGVNHRSARNNIPPSSVCDAEIRLIDVGLDPGVALSEMQGKILVQCQLGQEARFIGSVNLDSIRIENKTLSGFSTTFQQANRRLTLHDLKATAYDGHLEGSFQIATDTRAFTTDAKVTGLNLQKFARDTFASGRDINGELGAEFHLEGTGKDTAALTGNGVLRIRDAHLWEAPVLLEVVNTLKLTGRTPFTNVEIPFTIADRKFHTPKLAFQSDTASLNGSGNLDFDGNLDLTLEGEFISRLLPTIPVITPFLVTIERALYALDVSGTFKEPRVSPKPFPFLGGRDRAPREPLGPSRPGENGADPERKPPPTENGRPR